MICWAYLLYCAARRKLALRRHRYCVQRTRDLYDQHRAIGQEMLARLGVKAAEVVHG